MKKFLCILVTCLFVFTIVGCGEQNTYHMKCTVTNVEDNIVTVVPVEGSVELENAATFEINYSKFFTPDELYINDTLDVIYDGTINETNPGTFENVLDIRFVN